MPRISAIAALAAAATLITSTRALPDTTTSPLLPLERSSDCTEFQGNATTNPTGTLLGLIQGSHMGYFADPRCLYHDGVYYAYATNNYKINKTNVPLASSNDFNSGWSFVDYHDILPDPGPWTAKDKDGNANLWDPSVAYVDGRFVMYYAAKLPLSSGDGTSRCTGAAVAVNPRGPFKAQKKQLICADPVVKEKGNPYISPQLIQQDGQNYIVIKSGSGSNNGTNPNGHSRLQLYNVSADGLKVTSGPTTLYTSTKEDWDAEGPAIVYNDGVFFLLYVIRNYEAPEYAIHYVTSTKGIAGPYTTKGKVFLETGQVGNDGVHLLSPGGPSFFNATHMMLMTTKPTTADCTRGNADIRGPRVAVVKYSGETISLA